MINSEVIFKSVIGPDNVCGKKISRHERVKDGRKGYRHRNVLLWFLVFLARWDDIFCSNVSLIHTTGSGNSPAYVFTTTYRLCIWWGIWRKLWHNWSCMGNGKKAYIREIQSQKWGETCFFRRHANCLVHIFCWDKGEIMKQVMSIILGFLRRRGHSFGYISWIPTCYEIFA